MYKVAKYSWQNYVLTPPKSPPRVEVNSFLWLTRYKCLAALIKLKLKYIFATVSVVFLLHTDTHEIRLIHIWWLTHLIYLSAHHQSETWSPTAKHNCIASSSYSVGHYEILLCFSSLQTKTTKYLSTSTTCCVQ